MKFEFRQQNLLSTLQERSPADLLSVAIAPRVTSTAVESLSEGELLHELVERQVDLCPDAVAISDSKGVLTYADLDSRANRLAHELRRSGVRRGVLVGLYLPRSAEAIIAILAILKAGGAYVPIDPEYPRAWIARILADSQLGLVVTLQRLIASLPACVVRTVCVDALRGSPAERSIRTASCDALPSDPAYVIYTSGSTGLPKGVVVEHRNVVYSTRCRLDYYTEPVERLALIPSLAFDASIAAIFWALGRGGTLCLPPEGMEREPVRLSRWISEQRITHWLSVPALYRLLVDQPAEHLRSLRVVVLGGESCPPALVAAHQRATTGAELYNEYGPTEATIWCSVHRCEREHTTASVPIGRPLPGAQMYVCDDDCRPVPAGAAGELVIGGRGVARGYLSKPGLESRQFVRDILSHSAEGRLYRTGDRARQLLDGNFEFLGRLDSQIKVRGHRVELGQVEAALCSVDGVAQATVVTRRCGSSDQLVAFVVPQEAQGLTAKTIRQSLHDRLPGYMVPSRITVCDSLPLTVRGKVDRQELTKAAEACSRQGLAAAPPASECERRLLNCWQEVFDDGSIGAGDDFFELGGDSLLAAALFARIEAEFGLALAPETLLERPTVRLLAGLLDTASTVQVSTGAVPIRSGDQPPIFCLPGIGGHVLEFREFARNVTAERAVYGIRPAGLEDGRAPHSSIQEMARHAVGQMQAVAPHGPYALVGYSLGGVVAFEMARQLKQLGQSVSLLALVDSYLWSPTPSLSILDRIRLHAHNLLHSTPRGRRDYLCERGRLLLARLRRLQIRSAEDDVVLGLELSATSRRVARQHWKAWRNYRAGGYEGDILLFTARTCPESLAAHKHDVALGWAQRTSGSVRVRQTSARHAEMLRSESATILANAVNAELDSNIRPLAPLAPARD